MTTVTNESLKSRVIAMYTIDKMSRADIARKIGRCYETVSTIVRKLPDNGTTGSMAPARVKPELPWPRQGDMTLDQISACYAGQRYEDIQLTRSTLIPLNGKRLAFAAYMRNVSYGVGSAL